MTNEETIFAEALSKRSVAERAAYVTHACAGDVQLRLDVEALLLAHEKAAGILEASPIGLDVTSEICPTSEGVGATVGPYKLLEQIGGGGMGVVYMAEQLRPVRRKVALKIIKPGMDSGQVIARFEAERQALTMMDHPNIAKVLDAGTTDTGRPYFVMELVKGIPITDYCDQARLTTRQRLELFIQVCHAVQHAHQKGVIHRDLKPTNVLVTLHDDKPVPKVIDFGIAKAAGQVLTERTLFTNYAQMLGTPLYMSPEQAQISGLDVDTRSDVYSLGVLLYELLTGTTPFDKERLREAAYDEMRRIIREEDPPKPSTRLSTVGEKITVISAHRHTDPKKLGQLVRGELDWIVMKALEKDRSRRYETANGLARDIERHLHDESVQACPPSTWYRCRKFARRNKAALVIAMFIGSALLLTVAGLAVSTFLIAREQRTTVNALLAETLAKADLRRDSYYHRIALAYRELSVNNLAHALQLLEECPDDLREWEWYYLMRNCRVEPLILRDTTEVNSLAFSADGERLATAGGDGTVKVWNSRTGAVIQTLNGHPNYASSVAFHPDGKHLASVGADKLVKVWDLTTGLQVFADQCDVLHVFGTAYATAFSPDGRQIAAGNDGGVKIWEWEEHRLLHTVGGHDNFRISVAFSRDGRRMASGNWWGTVQLWDPAAGGEPLRTLSESREARHPVSALAFSPDGGRLAAASFERRVNLWDTTTGALLHILPHSGLALCVAYSPDGRRLASAGEDKIVHVWEATTGRELLGLSGHTGMCGCVAFSPDGRRLASASTDRTIRIWDATALEGPQGAEILTFREHNNEIWSLAVSPDGQKVVSAGFTSPPKVWDLQTGRVSPEFSGHRVVVFSVAWQPDGRRIASAGLDGPLCTVKVWDALTGQEYFTLVDVPAGPEFFAVAFSPDGRYLATGRANRSVQVWDARTGEPVGLLGNHDRVIRGVVFSSDGRHLASASADGVVKLWDATRLTEKQEARHSLQARVHGPSLNVAFSPDSRRVATGGEENTVKIWDVETGRELQTLRGHNGDVYTVAFSPDDDGRWVASAGEDSAVNVWDSHTGKLLRSLRGHTGLVSSIAFSRDGRRLISGSRDHTVKVWDTAGWDDVPDRASGSTSRRSASGGVSPKS